jgi:hypothetical protein
MNASTTACSILVFGLAAVPARAHGDAPVGSIATATLDRYRDLYPHSRSCARDELTLWRCETKKREFALCASAAVTRTTGYLQYRASEGGKPVFAYPAARRPPLGLFKYVSYGSGDASIEFTNAGYVYVLADPLRDRSSITVTAPGAQGKATTIACGPNQTLQVNYTMRLMHDAGIRDGE